MYLGGYAVECKIKAIAMEIHNCLTLDELVGRWGVDEREVYTHGLAALLRRLPSYERFRKSRVWHDFAGRVSKWRVDWRYDPRDVAQGEAVAFLKAVDRVVEWLNNNW
jgi:hypothetical protein